jgi:hypothetical protein
MDGVPDQWAAEGWYQLYVADRGPVPVEFSATANVLPARHLSLFIPPDTASTEQAGTASARASKGGRRVKGAGFLLDAGNVAILNAYLCSPAGALIVSVQHRRFHT